MSRERKNVLNKINDILDNKCRSCKVRKKLRSHTTSLHNYCLKKCDFGKELQRYGNDLISISNQKANEIINKGRNVTTDEINYLLERGFDRRFIKEHLSLTDKETERLFYRVKIGMDLTDIIETDEDKENRVREEVYKLLDKNNNLNPMSISETLNIKLSKAYQYVFEYNKEQESKILN